MNKVTSYVNIRAHLKLFCLYEMSTIGKHTKTESRLAVAYDRGGWRDKGIIAKMYKVSL